MARVRILKKWGSLEIGDIAELSESSFEFAIRRGFAEELTTSETPISKNTEVKLKGKPGRKPNAKN